MKPKTENKKASIKSILFSNIIYETEIGIANSFNRHFSIMGANISDSFDNVDICEIGRQKVSISIYCIFTMQS